ncbi:MAG: nitrous oxide reductase accessory protein NosL [Sulfurimonas sp.]|uniref:nitrous oxide reductase accessory protein NosL n=1 Tax=Sulfurimonas sp. TaxID=2022749 RepID=UPI002618F161|nr:nitrous oxide reductase accessory protein NosL [Sulfurimonas sp.]MDD2652803.1 nitrous oxide reductase accessory protein NosL [Sulfurimonas sp.]MDD3452114.1 nitrous oxide reductase accessory protein NosL [Sulfurimonas sp.]
MYKKIILSLSAVFLVGCGVQSGVATKNGMFQSVTEKEAVLLQDSKDRESCPRCGMNLPKYYKTNHSASLDGKTYQYCSIHCLQDHLYDGVSLKNPLVVDIATLKFIDATKAYYVVGSSVKGTMSRISKYAFATKEKAELFQKEHGGEILDFYQALEVAKKDFN